MSAAAAAAITASLDPPVLDLTPTPFGKPMRKWFLFPPTFRNMNQGSFGVTPTPVLAHRAHLLALSDARPDKFQRFTVPPLLVAARAAFARVLRAPLETLVIVPNATTGVNTALRNIRWAPGDRILYFSSIYGACEKTVMSVCETSAARPVPMPLRLGGPDVSPSAADIVALFERTVRDVRAAGANPRLLIFDTFASVPGVRMPFEALTAKCRELGVLSLIDGAHALGCIDLDLPALDPDFFVSNSHKWFFVPRGCAAFYVPVRNQRLIRTSYPTSHWFRPVALDDDDAPEIYVPIASVVGEENEFERNFSYTGTVDVTPYLEAPQAVDFREKVCGGEAAIHKYCNELARKGGARVAEILGTTVLDNTEGSLSADIPMVNILVPLDMSAIKVDESGPRGVGRWMERRCVEEADTFLKMDLNGQNELWLRLSAQVYLDMEDFEWAGQTVKALCERVKAGEHLANQL